MHECVELRTEYLVRSSFFYKKFLKDIRRIHENVMLKIVNINNEALIERRRS